MSDLNTLPESVQFKVPVGDGVTIEYFRADIVEELQAKLADSRDVFNGDQAVIRQLRANLETERARGDQIANDSGFLAMERAVYINTAKERDALRAKAEAFDAINASLYDPERHGYESGSESDFDALKEIEQLRAERDTARDCAKASSVEEQSGNVAVPVGAKRMSDLESLVRLAARMFSENPEQLAVNARRYDTSEGSRYWLDNWIRDKVERWLLEQGAIFQMVDGQYHWGTTITQKTIASHESRPMAALLALKEAR